MKNDEKIKKIPVSTIFENVLKKFNY